MVRGVFCNCKDGSGCSPPYLAFVTVFSRFGFPSTSLSRIWTRHFPLQMARRPTLTRIPLPPLREGDTSLWSKSPN